MRGRGVRLRRRSIAALLTITTVVVPAVTPSSTAAQTAAAATAPAAPAKVHAAARRSVLVGQKVPVSGAISSGQTGQGILVQTKAGRGWKTVAHTRTKAHGRFATSWRPPHIGSYQLRVRGTGAGIAPRTLHGHVAVFRAVQASYYGPGLYGQRLACGGTLTPSKLGVANKTLPCGTKVTLRFHGRAVTVSVIDRGPYVGGRVYDLTSATKSKLGFGSTGTVWSNR